MKFNQFEISSRKKPTRVGRGIAAGRGKTAGRGTKGQKSRTGGNIRPGFEGGQNPLMQRLPKLRGFKSHRQPAYQVYTGQLAKLGLKKVNPNILAEKGLIADPYHNVKLIVKGKLDKPVEVELQAASESAIEMLQASGGSFKQIARLQRSAQQNDKKQ